MVFEVESLMFWKRDVNENNEKYLLLCYTNDIDEKEGGEGGQWEGKVKGLQKQLAKLEDSVTPSLSEVKGLILSMHTQINELATKVNAILENNNKLQKQE